jgi:glycosyl hydrolase family 42 (putative beta-galactosidase)
VSCWVKGKSCGHNWIGGGPGWYTRTVFPEGDFDWRQVAFEMQTGTEPDNYELMVLSESTTEALWVDDVRFEPVKVDRAKQEAVYAEIDLKTGNLQRRLEAMENHAKGKDRLASSPYMKLGTVVAKRFIEFSKSGGPDGKMSLVWTRFQLDEAAQVLDETERLLKANPSLLTWQRPRPGTVTLRNGIFYEGGQPLYYAGYGHFYSVIRDLPNFPDLGASLIQDGRAGPSSLDSDGTLGQGATDVLAGLDRAAGVGMKEDFLLSPHYYPGWAEAPDLRNGNIGFLNFNIFHPKAMRTVQKWAEVMANQIEHKPALLSVCLANEPVYISSGRDSYTRPAFTEFLQQKHHDIAEMNALYGTSYRSFDEAPVPPPSMPAGVPAQRAYYDWTSFNKKMFADWHAGLASVLKKNGVKAPTHTKIMVFQTMDRDKLSHGVDPELMCRTTDLAGCDAYAFVGGEYAYDWFGQEFFYDLLHSFRGQSVFNSENHVIPDGSGLWHIPMTHTRSALWQGGLHHQGATTIWVWENATDSGLGGSIYFRPANVYGAGRAMLDLNRLAREATAINTAKPRVALLYSQPSIFWEEKYKGSMRSLYTALNFMGEAVTFVSERQLAEGTAPKVEWLIVANATHVLKSTPDAIAAFRKSGGRVLLAGKESLGRDEYDRPLSPASDYPTIELAGDDQATMAGLRQVLAPLQLHELADATTGKPAWGVEFRVVKQARAMLVPLINFNKATVKVKLPQRAKARAVDLLSGESVDLNSISLEPMVPRLLQIGG